MDHGGWRQVLPLLPGHPQGRRVRHPRGQGHHRPPRHVPRTRAPQPEQAPFCTADRPPNEVLRPTTVCPGRGGTAAAWWQARRPSSSMARLPRQPPRSRTCARPVRRRSEGMTRHIVLCALARWFVSPNVRPSELPPFDGVHCPLSSFYLLAPLDAHRPGCHRPTKAPSPRRVRRCSWLTIRSSSSPPK